MEKLEQRINELERRIQIQEDIRAIERLQANYWDCLDKKDWDGLRVYKQYHRRKIRWR